MVFTGYLQGIYRVFTGYLQGIYRVFVTALPLEPSGVEEVFSGRLQVLKKLCLRREKTNDRNLGE